MSVETISIYKVRPKLRNCIAIENKMSHFATKQMYVQQHKLGPESACYL